MPENLGKSRPKRGGRIELSELHEAEQFGELQGELRENADDVGYGQQLLLEGAPGHDQQLPQSDRQEDEERRYDRRQQNRPRPIARGRRDRD